MKLDAARLLADENILDEVVAFFRQRGCDVAAVRGLGLVGAEDRELLRLSVVESRVVLTHDSDFGTLAIASREPAFGIVYLRPGHLSPDFTIGTLRALFDMDLELEPPFLLVARRKGNAVGIRVRKL